MSRLRAVCFLLPSRSLSRYSRYLPPHPLRSWLIAAAPRANLHAAQRRQRRPSQCVSRLLGVVYRVLPGTTTISPAGCPMSFTSMQHTHTHRVVPTQQAPTCWFPTPATLAGPYWAAPAACELLASCSYTPLLTAPSWGPIQTQGPHYGESVVN